MVILGWRGAQKDRGNEDLLGRMWGPLELAVRNLK